MPKYIRDENDNVVIFPISMKHADVAIALQLTVKSAGTFAGSYDDVIIGNRSDTLNLDPLSDDAEIIKNQM
jgi:hypothetical protein